MDNILKAGIEAAVESGAEFGEARWHEVQNQVLMARGQVLTHARNSRESGMGIRAYYNGAWGFAGAQAETVDEASKLGKKAVDIAKASAHIQHSPLQLTPVKSYQENWISPVQIDPMSVSVKEKAELLLELNALMMKEEYVRDGMMHMRFLKHHKIYANSIGSLIDQTQLWSNIDGRAVAVGTGKYATRGFQLSPKGIGYEIVDEKFLFERAKQVGREAAEKLRAKPIKEEISDLILLPNHTRLVIHETIGHATELDRVLGWEADYAGTSFATPDKLGSLAFGAPILNVTADRTQSGGLATCAFDDEGIPSQEWKIIKEGVLIDYSTTRDTAPFIGHLQSHGCAFADHWSSVPILRMANIGIDSGGINAPDLDQLISDTKSGVIIDGMDSFSIDHQRINFQFGGDYCRRIQNGKISEVISHLTYEGSNPMFWNSIDAICRKEFWRPQGIWGCAKGQPVQTAALTHGSAPLRLHNIKIRSVD
ncbi:TldD/PmbA family protein [bacterium]|nr:TldD/PmbA family protein [candidate division CSSED10-310 bacterium]